MKLLIRFSMVLAFVITTIVFALPKEIKEQLPDGKPPFAEKSIIFQPSSWMWKIKNFLLSQDIKYGLDLSGGSQLDFIINLDQYRERIDNEKRIAKEEGKEWNEYGLSEEQIVEGVKQTLSRRIDPDGTKEVKTIISDFGGEKHIIIELAADLDTQENREKLKQVIDLVFKEQKTEDTGEEKAITKEKADSVFKTIDNNSNLEKITQDIQEEKPEQFSIVYNADVKRFKDQIASDIQEKIWDAKNGIYKEVLPSKGSFTYDQITHQVKQLDAYSIFKIKGKEIVEREKTKRAEDFDIVALELSERNIEEKESKNEDGEIKKEKNVIVKSAIELSNEVQDKIKELSKDSISDVIEVDNGYAIYKIINKDEENIEMKSIQVKELFTKEEETINKAKERLTEKNYKEDEEQITYDEIMFTITPNIWKEAGLDGRHFRTAKVATTEAGQPIVEILFNEQGKKIFADLTKRLIEKPIAIFVGGKLISAPIVQQEIPNGSAQISINAENYYEGMRQAVNLAQNLNAGAIPAPISLVSETSITASLGKDSLNISIKAGLIGLVVLSIWMIFSYRLLGIFSVISLLFYVSLLVFSVSIGSLPFILALLISIIAGFIMFSSISKVENDSLISAFIAFLFAILILVILEIQIVLTLAGIAGIILSIGMAVDANILVFERIREELKKGNNYSMALSIGFERAWTSIRDANITTIIVCLILYFGGTEMIKMFALMLGVGVFVSMFTSIVLTRYLMTSLQGKNIVRKNYLVTKL